MADEVRVSVSRSENHDAKKQISFNTAKGEFHRLDPIITMRCWSPVIWLNGIRKKQNFMSSQVIALDFDDGETTLEAANDWGKSLGLNFLIATTKSHQKMKGKKEACDRFRLLIEAELCLGMDDFEHTMKVYCENLGADIACKDAGRFYYPCTRVVYRGYGYKAKWLPCPPAETTGFKAEKQKKFFSERQRNLNFPRNILEILIHGAPEGKREVSSFVAGCYFARAGFTEDEAFDLFKDFKSPLLYGGGRSMDGIGEKEIRHALSTAYRYVRDEMKSMAIEKKGDEESTRA